MVSTMNGHELKQAGLDLVEKNNPTWLESMRSKARSIARQKGTVCADDLRDYSDQLEEVEGIVPTTPNAWGSLFRSREFEYLYSQPSNYPSNHSRRINVYKVAA